MFGRPSDGGSPARTERKTPAGSLARKRTQGRVLILVFITENGVISHSLLLCVNLISPTPSRKKSFSHLVIEFLCPPPVGGLVFFQSTNVDGNDNAEVPVLAMLYAGSLCTSYSAVKGATVVTH